MKKRTLAFILAALMALTAIVVVPVGADYTSGDWGYTVSNGKATINRYYGSELEVTIPSEIDGYPVTELRSWQDGYGSHGIFFGKSTTSVTIPDSVTTIGDSAFFVCELLTNVSIPDSVTTISEWAFFYCTSLTNVTIPCSVTTIGESAFSECISLTSIDVDPINTTYKSIDGVLYSKDGDILIAFPGGKTSVTIPNSVTRIANYAFYWCTSLTSVTIPDSVTTIGDNAFAGCRSLTSVTIANSVTEIGARAFYYCTSLTSVIIPDSVTTIGEGIFSYCPSLTNVTIGNGVTAIGGSTFSECELLTNVTIGNSVTSIGQNAFFICPSLTSVTIPYSVTTIRDNAFLHCTSLTTVYYTGTQAQWNAISIGSNNDSLLNANILFNYVFHDHDYIASFVDPTCTKPGGTLYTCSICGDSYTVVGSPALGHNFVDGVCTRCGEERPMESEHPYQNNSDESWVINRPGAGRISITFSSDTETESGYDFICIYDMNGNQVGSYSGTELSGQTITVDGDTVTIRLTSDGSVTKYGFVVTNIEAQYPVVTYGDADGNGEIASKDVTLIRRYIAAYDEVTGTSTVEVAAGADANGDGEITSKDVTLLRRYIANYDDETGTSTVVLGPSNNGNESGTIIVGPII